MSVTPQSLGGHARAQALTRARRSEIAKQAAAARWAGHKPKRRRPKRLTWYETGRSFGGFSPHSGPETLKILAEQAKDLAATALRQAITPQKPTVNQFLENKTLHEDTKAAGLRRSYFA